ncbi:MAG TPA: hypothetical protein VGI71_06335 [Scandinavium sp.]
MPFIIDVGNQPTRNESLSICVAENVQMSRLPPITATNDIKD